MSFPWNHAIPRLCRLFPAPSILQHPMVLALLVAGVSSSATTAADPRGSHAFSSELPLNPIVQALVDSVSAERLEESVSTLVSFTTRHTTSDTVSSTSGIGATRNWVRDQLEVYATANGGIQTPGFHDWNETVCTLPGIYRNVLSQQIGAVYPERYFLVGAHLDSRTIDVCNAISSAPGADDDGSGCAAALELAYLIGKIPVESSMVFMTFTGEEQGLLGSTAYADEAAADGLDIAGMINNDTIGNIQDIAGMQDSTSCRAFSGGPATSTSRQLARYLKLRGEAYQPDFEVNLIPLLDRLGRGGDHIPFYNNGYAAARLIESLENGDGTGNNGHQHNGTDLPEFMNFPYCARVCRVNVAALASLLMGPKPPAGLQVADVGSGSEVFVGWDANSEADLAGYRIAFRFEEGDSLFYQDVLDAGLATSSTLGGLQEDVPILVSVSAYDTDFNESVFGDEQRVVPASLPTAPSGFQATSKATRVELDWNENPELDIQGYNLYRSTSFGGPFGLLQSLSHPTTHFEDTNTEPDILYYYELRAIDDDGQEGAAAGPVKGRLLDHARDILIVDATPDGPTITIPADASVDLFYTGMLSGVTVAGEWDRADSLLVGNQLSDADLGAHRTVVYHVDAFEQFQTTASDTSALRKYVQNGGKLLISSSRTSFTLGGSIATSPVSWGPGDFMHDVLQATETWQSQEFDLGGVLGQLPGYPDLDVDQEKILFDRLPLQDAYIGPLVGVPTTEVLYHYESTTGGPNQDLADAIRFLAPDFKLIAFSFPLYFMDSLSVRQTIATALADLGETTSGVAGGAPQLAFSFGLSEPVPNPFNPSVRIDYAADRREALALRVFDVQGRLVRTLVDRRVEPGRYVAIWNGRSDGGGAVRSGVYFLELAGSGQERLARRKLVLLR